MERSTPTPSVFVERVRKCLKEKGMTLASVQKTARKCKRVRKSVKRKTLRVGASGGRRELSSKVGEAGHTTPRRDEKSVEVTERKEDAHSPLGNKSAQASENKEVGQAAQETRVALAE